MRGLVSVGRRVWSPARLALAAAVLSPTTALACECTCDGQVGRWLSFVNLVWGAAAVLLLVAVLWLIGTYVVPVLQRLPATAKEALAYLACLAPIAGAAWCPPHASPFVALPGCLGLIPALAYSHSLRGRWSVKLDLLGLALVWGAVALAYRSSLLGGMAEAALLGFLGVLAFPWLDVFEFRRFKAVPPAMTAALALMLGAALLEWRGGPATGRVLETFGPGAWILGAPVFLGGCLALATRSATRDWTLRIGTNLFALAAGVGALFLGTMLEIEPLREASGSFLLVFLLEKVIDLPWRKATWGWACLLVSVVLYAGAGVAATYPDYFLGFAS